jgi:hypothetical protein
MFSQNTYFTVKNDLKEFVGKKLQFARENFNASQRLLCPYLVYSSSTVLLGGFLW